MFPFAPGWMWLCFIAVMPVAGAVFALTGSNTAGLIVLLVVAIVVVQVVLTGRVRRGKNIYARRPWRDAGPGPKTRP